MAPAIPVISRRAFLSASASVALASAAPAFAATLAAPGPLALASTRTALPATWSGPAVILTGDYMARLEQVRATLANPGSGKISLFLDAADTVLFDIANHDRRVAVSPPSAQQGVPA